MQAIKVRLAEATLLDFQEAHTLKLLEMGAYTSLARTHVVGELQLTGKAGIVAPRIFQEHRVSELRSNRNVLLGENEIRDLRKTVTCGEVSTDNLDVTIFENVADVALGCGFHTDTLYAAHIALPCLSPFSRRAVSGRSLFSIFNALHVGDATGRGMPRLVGSSGGEENAQGTCSKFELSDAC